ncbi:hypothetical protein ABPG72_015419, partial [Tetrahymena utriculariae]
CSPECATCYDSTNEPCLKYAYVEYNNQCVQRQVENCIQCDKQFICNRCARGYILQTIKVKIFDFKQYLETFFKNQCVPDFPESQVLEDFCKYSRSNNILDIQNRQCLDKQYFPSMIRYNHFCNSNVSLTTVFYNMLLYTFDNGGYIQVFKYPSLDYVTQKFFSSDSQIIDWIFLSISTKKVISISSTQINLIDLEIFALLNTIVYPSSKIIPNSQILYNQKIYITPSGSNLIVTDFQAFNQTSYQLKEDISSTSKAWDTKKFNLIVKTDDNSFSYIDTTQNSIIQVSCSKCQGISSFYLTNNIFIGNSYSQTLTSIFYLNLTDTSGTLIFQKTLTIQEIIVYDNLLPPYYIIIYSEETYCLYYINQEQYTLVTYLEDDYDFQIQYETLDLIIQQQYNSRQPSQIQCLYSVDKEQIVIGQIDNKLYLYQIDLLNNYKVTKRIQLNLEYTYIDYEINMQNQLVFKKNQYFIFIVLNFNLDIVFEQQFSKIKFFTNRICIQLIEQRSSTLIQQHGFLYQLSNSTKNQQISLPNLKISTICGYLDSPWVFFQGQNIANVINYLTSDILLQQQQEGMLQITQQNWFSSTIFGFIRNYFELNIFNCDSKQLKSQSFGQSIQDYNIYDFNIELITFLRNYILAYDYLNQNIINQINLSQDIISQNVVLPVRVPWRISGKTSITNQEYFVFSGVIEFQKGIDLMNKITNQKMLLFKSTNEIFDFSTYLYDLKIKKQLGCQQSDQQSSFISYVGQIQMFKYQIIVYQTLNEAAPIVQFIVQQKCVLIAFEQSMNVKFYITKGEVKLQQFDLINSNNQVYTIKLQTDSYSLSEKSSIKLYQEKELLIIYIGNFIYFIDIQLKELISLTVLDYNIVDLFLDKDRQILHCFHLYKYQIFSIEQIFYIGPPRIQPNQMPSYTLFAQYRYLFQVDTLQDIVFLIDVLDNKDIQIVQLQELKRKFIQKNLKLNLKIENENKIYAQNVQIVLLNYSNREIDFMIIFNKKISRVLYYIQEQVLKQIPWSNTYNVNNPPFNFYSHEIIVSENYIILFDFANIMIKSLIQPPQQNSDNSTFFQNQLFKFQNVTTLNTCYKFMEIYCFQNYLDALVIIEQDNRLKVYNLFDNQLIFDKYLYLSNSQTAFQINIGYQYLKCSIFQQQLNNVTINHSKPDFGQNIGIRLLNEQKLDNIIFSNIFQNYLQNPPLAQAINVQGSQQFEISNSVFEKNSNIRFIFTPNLPISQAELVQNQFVKFKNIYVRNLQHFACLIEGSAYDNNCSRTANTDIIHNYQMELQVYMTFIVFCLKKAIESYGGAITIQQSLVYSFINNIFQGNQAKKDSAGAIQLVSTDIKTFKKFYGNYFENNQAAIGGCMRYYFALPSFIDQNNTYLQNKTFKNNKASLYGADLASDPQGIALAQQNFNISTNYANDTIQNYTITNQISGNYLEFPLKIVLTDQNMLPIVFPYSLCLSNLNYQKEVEQAIINQRKNPENNFPVESGAVKKLNSFHLTKFNLTVNVEFGKCLPGDILVFNYQIVTCQPCPSGKFTLVDISKYRQYDSNLQQDQSLQQSKICPEQAVSCEKNFINLKNGYWRLNNMTYLIYDFQDSRKSSLPENPNSRQGRQIGYIGIYCAECDYRAKLWDFQYGIHKDIHQLSLDYVFAVFKQIEDTNFQINFTTFRLRPSSIAVCQFGLSLCFLVLAIQKNISHSRKSIQIKYILPSVRDYKAQGLFIYLFYSPSFLIKLISYMICSSTSSFSHLVGEHSYSCFTAQHQGYFYILLLPLFIFWAFVFPLTLIFILRKNYVSFSTYGQSNHMDFYFKSIMIKSILGVLKDKYEDFDNGSCDSFQQ